LETPFAAYRGDEPCIFVCYAHEDSDVVYPEMAWLREQGLNLWYDEGISAGKNWRAAIGDSLLGASHVLFYISPRSLESDHCNREINLALDEGKDIVPIYLEDVELTSDLKVGLNRVQALHRDQDANYSQHLLNALGQTAETTPPSPRQKPRFRWRRYVPIGLAAALLAGIGWWYWDVPMMDAEDVDVSQTSDDASIAVLPFVNLSPDPEQEYFADGITEDIITGLSKLPDLFVIARNSTFTYKGQSVAVSQVARDLGVRYVLEGSVRKAGNRLRITAQFIDGVTGDHLWGEKFDRDIDDIFELQDEITLNIISSIQIPIITTEAQQTRQRNMPDLTTWDLVARAKYRFSRLSQESIEEARRLAGQILARDPESATAMTLIANCHSHDVFLDYSKDTERSIAAALDLIQRAISIDEESFYAHWVKGNLELWHLRRHSAAINEFDRSLQLNPNFHQAIGNLGMAQAYGGEPEKGIEQIERSIRADPRGPGMFFRFQHMAECHFIAGRYQEALDWLDKCLLRHGNYGDVLRLMTICQSHLGRIEEARATLQKWRGLFPASTIANVYRPPYQNSADLKRYLDGLRHAGLSEN